MNAVFADSSALAAVMFGEPGGVVACRILARSDRVLASNLLEAELRSAARREGLPPSVVAAAVARAVGFHVEGAHPPR